jgi:uncharacterized protein (TIGR03000 family)
MMRQWCSIARVGALTTAALLFAAGPSLAQHGGGGHGGGGHGGGGHGGGGHASGGHGSGGHGGSFSHGGAGGFHHGGSGFHNGGYYHNRGFYGFGIGLGYPWYGGYGYGGYGYYPGYYDSWYYGDYAPRAYYPGYSNYAATPDSYADTYSYPPAAIAPQNPSLATVPQTLPPPNENAIYIRVQVPRDAEVWFEDQLTTQKGPVRFFESPSLTPGRKYVYHIKARWTENGKVIEKSRDYEVYAGDKFSTDFTKMTDNAPAKPSPAGS